MPLQPYRNVGQVDPNLMGIGAVQNIQKVRNNDLLNIGKQNELDEFDLNAPVRDAARQTTLDDAKLGDQKRILESLQIGAKIILPDIKAGNPNSVRQKLIERRRVLDEDGKNTTQTDDAIRIVDQIIANPDDPQAQQEYVQFATMANEFATMSDKANAKSGGNRSKGGAGRYRYTDAEGNTQNGTGVETYDPETDEVKLQIVGPDGRTVPSPTNIMALNDLDQTAEEAGAASVSQAGRERAAEKAAEIAALPEKIKVEAFADKAKNNTIYRTQLLSQKNNLNGLMGELTDAYSNSNIWTTGVGGAITGLVPGTDAYTLKNTFASILSDIGFDRLQKMRDESPTGGALGQVSNFELDLLKASLTGIDRLENVEDVKKALLKVREYYKNMEYLNEKKLQVSSAISKGASADKIAKLEDQILTEYQERLSAQGRTVETEWASVYGNSGEKLGQGDDSAVSEAMKRMGVVSPDKPAGSSSEIDDIAAKYRNPQT